MKNLSNNLNTFKILFLVKGILTLFFSIFFIFYALLGGFISGLEEVASDPDLPFNPGIIFLVIGIVGFLVTIVVGTLTLVASKYLGEIKNATFILVVAILNCFTGVLGILLGVFTILELNKPEVKELFDKNKSPKQYQH